MNLQKFCGPLSWGYGLQTHKFVWPLEFWIWTHETTNLCGLLSWGYLRMKQLARPCFTFCLRALFLRQFPVFQGGGGGGLLAHTARLTQPQTIRGETATCSETLDPTNNATTAT